MNRVDRRRLREVMPTGLGFAITTVLGGLASDAVKGGDFATWGWTWTHGSWASPLLRLALLALFTAAVCWTAYSARGLIMVGSKTATDYTGKAAAMVLPLSTANGWTIDEEASTITFGTDSYKFSDDLAADMVGLVKLQELARATNPRAVINLLQPMRALHRHLPDLQHLHLVGSLPGSLPAQGPAPSSFISVVTPLQAQFRRWARGTEVTVGSCDFEKLESLRTCFEDQIKLWVKGGISERRIVLDVTPGQKPVSIAASLSTLQRDSLIQYVDFDGEVVVFETDVSRPG